MPRTRKTAVPQVPEGTPDRKVPVTPPRARKRREPAPPVAVATEAVEPLALVATLALVECPETTAAPGPVLDTVDEPERRIADFPIAEAPSVESPADAAFEASSGATPLQLLTFVVEGNEYGIEIHQVQEIRGYTRLTVLPNMPRHFRGLLDVRGTVVPVFDLRAWFGGQPVECTPITVIVTVNVCDRLVGLLVDAVSDVREVEHSALAAPPDMGMAVDTSLLDGLAPVDGRLLSVLDLERVVGGMLAA